MKNFHFSKCKKICRGGCPLTNMRLNLIEALVALADNSKRKERLAISKWRSELLVNLGAPVDASRKLLPDFVLMDTFMGLISHMQSLPKDKHKIVAAALVSLRHQQGSASSTRTHQVVDLEVLTVIAVMVCTGSLHERLSMAFWILDRDCSGYVTSSQLMQAVEHLLRVAEVANQILLRPASNTQLSSSVAPSSDYASSAQQMTVQPNRSQNNKQYSLKEGRHNNHGHNTHGTDESAAAPDRGLGEEDDLSRALMLEAVARTLADLDPSGSNRLSEAQVHTLVFRTVMFLTNALVQAATTTTSAGSTTINGTTSTPPRATSSASLDNSPAPATTATTTSTSTASADNDSRAAGGPAHAAGNSSRHNRNPTISSAAPAAALAGTAHQYEVDNTTTAAAASGQQSHSINHNPQQPTVSLLMSASVQQEHTVIGNHLHDTINSQHNRNLSIVSTISETGSVVIKEEGTYPQWVFGPSGYVPAAAATAGDSGSKRQQQAGSSSSIDSTAAARLYNAGNTAQSGTYYAAAVNAVSWATYIPRNILSYMWTNKGGDTKHADQQPSSSPPDNMNNNYGNALNLSGSHNPAFSTSSLGCLNTANDVSAATTYRSHQSTKGSRSELINAGRTRSGIQAMATTSRSHAVGGTVAADHHGTTPSANIKLRPVAGSASPFSTPGAANAVFSAVAGSSRVELLTQQHSDAGGVIHKSSLSKNDGGGGGEDNEKSSFRLSPIHSSLHSLPIIQSASTQRSAPSLKPEISNGGIRAPLDIQANDSLLQAQGVGGTPSKASVAPILRGELSRVSVLEAAVERAERAVMASEKKSAAGTNVQRTAIPAAQVNRGGLQPGAGNDVAASSTPAAVASTTTPPTANNGGGNGGRGTGGAVGQVIRSSIYEAGVKLFLNCGICLLSVISLLLADSALVVWVFDGRGYSLEAALIIVAGVDIGVLLVLLAVVLIRAKQASLRKSRDSAQAAAQASSNKKELKRKDLILLCEL
ncbi:hypothetical protein CEUSTIGMA_g6080.t1 [Chlamydomonas eustigma]|uniref:EF-hand domain-containing protein n=1 Tax=Chlamydomonas eustigma TaxID=1157962 RepID=A0A250X6X6_9CHLO|nr:hypothetical protein CEUSTIGMA_g6080.t1 [Chlamydomonas eustigma]|eukprot:GAX78642.1 hypothetical protein CEUSTIGMA_g6080.t1 [Chlamydomonas eustigma]